MPVPSPTPGKQYQTLNGSIITVTKLVNGPQICPCCGAPVPTEKQSLQEIKYKGVSGVVGRKSGNMTPTDWENLINREL